ncbi:metallophosphoesterase [Rhodococcus phage Peregrin]|nr:metallophosphoesterase [Rhodococcus phage Peregrin]
MIGILFWTALVLFIISFVASLLTIEITGIAYGVLAVLFGVISFGLGIAWTVLDYNQDKQECIDKGGSYLQEDNDNYCFGIEDGKIVKI